ncbi:hypothetical protein McpSp1_09140 [Methanocorpusculaceae archaeon Sp1]|nr:hypothetical protein [Methanocorpusculaceae archaeon Sp1]
MKQFILSLDFDGCIVDNKYPEIGNLKPHAADVIRNLYETGHTIIINSCRAGDREKDMRQFLQEQKIPYDHINNNSGLKIAKYGFDTRKISADIYIDDLNIFCTKIDWQEIKEEIERRAKVECVTWIEEESEE